MACVGFLGAQLLPAEGPRTPIPSSFGGTYSPSPWLVLGPWLASSWAYLRGWRGKVVRPLRAAVTAVLRSGCMVAARGGCEVRLRVARMELREGNWRYASRRLAAWQCDSHISAQLRSSTNNHEHRSNQFISLPLSFNLIHGVSNVSESCMAARGAYAARHPRYHYCETPELNDGRDGSIARSIFQFTSKTPSKKI